MTPQVRFVDVYPFRVGPTGIEVLALRRAPSVRSAGAWEAVHGHIEAGESPVVAALRELEEETGCHAERFYNLSRVEAFYLHRLDQVALIPAFAARLDAKAAVQLSNEHDQLKWVPVGSASSMFAWPREHRALADLAHLLREGDAGALEEVLRIER